MTSSCPSPFTNFRCSEGVLKIIRICHRLVCAIRRRTIHSHRTCVRVRGHQGLRYLDTTTTSSRDLLHCALHLWRGRQRNRWRWSNCTNATRPDDWRPPCDQMLLPGLFVQTVHGMQRSSGDRVSVPFPPWLLHRNHPLSLLWQLGTCLRTKLHR